MAGVHFYSDISAKYFMLQLGYFNERFHAQFIYWPRLLFGLGCFINNILTPLLTTDDTWPHAFNQFQEKVLVCPCSSVMSISQVQVKNRLNSWVKMMMKNELI